MFQARSDAVEQSPNRTVKQHGINIASKGVTLSPLTMLSEDALGTCTRPILADPKQRMHARRGMIKKLRFFHMFFCHVDSNGSHALKPTSSWGISSSCTLLNFMF